MNGTDVKFSASDILMATATVYGEARGSSQDDREAVVHVMLNRLDRPGWWSRNKDDIPDDTLSAVCREPFQFSCWNDGDPNCDKLLSILASPQKYVRDATFRSCATAVSTAIIARLAGEDPTSGSAHYHTIAMGFPKTWGAKKSPTVIIGAHAFYNDID